MRITTYDPAYRMIGSSTVDVAEGGVIKEVENRVFGARPGDSEIVNLHRINSIALSDLLRLRPDAIAIEQYFLDEKEAFAVNDAGRVVVHVAGARLVIKAVAYLEMACAAYGVVPDYITPSQVKAVARRCEDVVGLHGTAGKAPVGAWAAAILGVSVHEFDHVDDARALAIVRSTNAEPGEKFVGQELVL